MERKPTNRNEAKTDHVRNIARKETDHIRYCRYCKSRDITPVKIISHYGKKTRVCYNCPICGEYLDVKWEKGGAQNET